MSAISTWVSVVLACCFIIGALAFPQQPDEDDHDHDHDHDHDEEQAPGSPCIPSPHHHDVEVYRPDSPNNFLPPVPGLPIEIEMQPSMVSVHDGNNYLCAASLISKYYAIAAKTDVEGLDPTSDNYYIHERMGYSHRDHGGCSYQISSIIIHGNLAALRTISPVYLVPGYIETIEVASPDHPFTPEQPASVIGWGHPKREDREGGSHTQLHMLNVTMKNDEYCTDALGDRLYNSTEMLCATGHDGCTGSSPLIQDDKVIGFVASSFGCGEEGYPMEYIAAANYKDWIDGLINEEDEA